MKKLIAAILCGALLCSPAFAFTVEDISSEEIFTPEFIVKDSASDWAQNEILAAQRAGLVPQLTGSPGYRDTITREQFAELIANAVNVICGGDLYDEAEVQKMHFTDCDNESVLEAASIGVVSGIGNGKFAPKQATNREQIASMIARSIAYIKSETGRDLAPAAADISGFSDKGQVSDWAVSGVGTLAANGIMAGTSATTLSPKASCTVEQSILFVYRVYQKAMK